MAAHPSAGSSDYGSDFSPEEEEALIELLSQAPLIIEAAPSFQLDDIEDHNSPRGAILPRRLRLERWDEVVYASGSVPETQPKGVPSLEICGDTSRTQIGL